MCSNPSLTLKCTRDLYMCVVMVQKGRRFEHTVANEMHNSDAEIYAWPAGYSGSNAVPSPDVVVVGNGVAGGVELKRTQQDSFSIGENELQQLLQLQQPFFHVAVAVKFTHREPVIGTPAFSQHRSDSDVSLCESVMHSIPDACNPRVTTGGAEHTLRFDKPSLDEWPSARNGSSTAQKLIDDVFTFPSPSQSR